MLHHSLFIYTISSKYLSAIFCNTIRQTLNVVPRKSNVFCLLQPSANFTTEQTQLSHKRDDKRKGKLKCSSLDVISDEKP